MSLVISPEVLQRSRLEEECRHLRTSAPARKPPTDWYWYIFKNHSINVSYLSCIFINWIFLHFINLHVIYVIFNIFTTKNQCLFPDCAGGLRQNWRQNASLRRRFQAASCSEVHFLLRLIDSQKQHLKFIRPSSLVQERNGYSRASRLSSSIDSDEASLESLTDIELGSFKSLQIRSQVWSRCNKG